MALDQYDITRVYISLTDATNFTASDGTGIESPSTHFNQCSVQLPNYIEGAVFIELLNAQSDFLNTLIQIQGWGDFSTSKGKQYWRYVDESSNNRSVDIAKSILRHPTRLRTLDLQFYDSLSNDKYLSSNRGGFEIEIYSLRKQ